MTIDASAWTRPTPDEVRTMIEATGLTKVEIASRLDITESRIGHWFTHFYHITYVEWLALDRLREVAASGERPPRK